MEWQILSEIKRDDVNEVDIEVPYDEFRKIEIGLVADLSNNEGKGPNYYNGARIIDQAKAKLAALVMRKLLLSEGNVDKSFKPSCLITNLERGKTIQIRIRYRK